MFSTNVTLDGSAHWRHTTFVQLRPADSFPDPQGQPGYLRVDTVHQDDLDGAKGVYHINAVDEVTQWQVVACVPRISEAWLQPVLQAMLKQFPFAIRGFHSDNGSRVRQRHGCAPAEQAVDRADQESAAAQQR